MQQQALLYQNKLQQGIVKLKTSPYLCTAKSQQGRLAERLGSGLQNRVQQFKSATDLRKNSETSQSMVSEFLIFEKEYNIFTASIIGYYIFTDKHNSSGTRANK